jgi:SAM-dependent methyltransferase
MMDLAAHKLSVTEFYDKTQSTFDVSYDWRGPIYPSNRVRMDHCLDRLAKAGAHRVLDAGCGTGIILLELLRRGYDAYGFDLSTEAIAACRIRLEASGYDPARARVGDLECTDLSGGILFDAVVIMGAFTHPLDHAKALRSLHMQMKPGGLLIVELRNELFKFFAHDELVLDLYRQILPTGPVADSVLPRLAAALPPRVSVSKGDAATEEHEQFFSVPSVWRNPLIVQHEYRSSGFATIDLLFFHWHAAPPSYSDASLAEQCRAQALELEHYPHDWRGYFMASAFLLCAEAD